MLSFSRLFMLLFLVPGSVLVARAQGAFDPVHQQRLVVKLTSHKVTLLQGTPLKIEVTSAENSGNVLGVTALPPEMVQVDGIYEVKSNEAIVMGRVNGSVSEVVLLDLQKVKLIDAFWCYKPSLAPNKKYIAFIKFYPQHFVEGVSDEYMVYDLVLSPKENRDGKFEDTDKKNVGRVVYPLGLQNADNDNIVQNASLVNRCMANELFWSPDSKALLFINKRGDDSALVSIGIEGTPVLREYPRLKEQLCSSHPCLPYLQLAKFKGDNDVTLTFRLDFLYGDRQLTISMSEFK